VTKKNSVVTFTQLGHRSDLAQSAPGSFTEDRPLPPDPPGHQVRPLHRRPVTRSHHARGPAGIPGQVYRNKVIKKHHQ
jgi:hypothetical protein